MRKKIARHLFRALRFSIKNIIRALFFLTVFVSIALCAGWFLAIKYFNAQHIGTSLIKILQETFDRPVVMESMKLVSLNAIEIKKLRIVDTTLEDYNDFLSVDSVVIRYNLMPLLENKIEIKEVILQNPSVDIIKDAQGRYNLPDFNASSKESALGQQFDIKSSGGKALQIIIEDWTIKNGTFSYRDLGGEISHSLNGIYIHFYNLKFNAFTDYSLNFVLRNKVKDKIVETEVVSEGAINFADFQPSQMALSDGKFELRGFRAPLNINIEAKDFLNPSVNLDMVVPAFSYEDLSLFLPKHIDFQIPSFNLKAEVSFTDNFKNINVPFLNLSNMDITLNLPGKVDLSKNPADITARFETSEFEASKADYFSLLTGFDLKGKVSGQGDIIFKNGKFSMPKVNIILNGVAAKISNFIIEGAKGRYEATDNFNLMKADVSDGVFKVGRQVISKIKGNTNYNHKKQTFYAILTDSLLNGKKIRMSVDIKKVRQANRNIKTFLYLDTLKPMEVFDTTEDFVAALVPGHTGAKNKDESDLAWLRNFRTSLPRFMPNFNGFIYADNFETSIISGKNFNAEFDLRNLLPGMDKLDGKIDARLENGVIYKLSEAAERQKALGIAFQPFVIMNNMERAGSFKMGKVLKDTPFEIMTASVDFNNGKMDINNFYVDGSVIAATVDGKVDWIGESLDLDIVSMFKNTSKRGVLSENLTDESGEPALAFRTANSMKHPSVQMRSPKKTGVKIKQARERGLRTDFSAGQKFVKEK